VVVGAKAVAFLADRAIRTSTDEGVTVFAGATLPPNLLSLLTNRHGAFPPYLSLDPTRIDWITSALIDPLWAEAVPTFSLVWMNEPDLTQHETGPGSERSLAAIRNADKNLARILTTLEAKGLRDSTDVFVVSDHGASTISARLDVADLLTKAGLKAVREFKGEPSAGSILAVSDGGSTFIYVIGHDEQVIRQVVQFLQRAEFSGVIFTRKALPGTFALRDVRLDADAAPDVVVAMRWNSDRSQNGIAGMVQSDESTYGPGQGSHVTLSPFDMHATLVAAGPDFREGVVDTLASGNVDIAPTVLWILGLRPPSPMDGRVLTEALTIKGPQIRSFQPGHIEAKSEVEGVGWSQYLNFTEVNGVRYLDEGNGAQAPARLAK
jgi:arylsulfatase A-like enzyme